MMSERGMDWRSAGKELKLESSQTSTWLAVTAWPSGKALTQARAIGLPFSRWVVLLIIVVVRVFVGHRSLFSF